MAGVEAVPEVRFARVGDVSIAYQVFGDGPATILTIPPMAQNIELLWERPEHREVFERIGRFARLVHFDKRGTGASDRTVPIPTLDERVDDTKAVMDAAGIDRAVLSGVSEGGPMALLFAVTYPERVSALMLHSTAAVLIRDEAAEDRETRHALIDLWLDRWGTDDTLTLQHFAPSAYADPSYRAWQPRYERQSASPAALRDLVSMYEQVDVEDVLTRVEVPTLVLHRRGDRVIPIDEARKLASAIPNARLVELDGSDHYPHVGDVHTWIDEVEAFVTGVAPTPVTNRRRTTRSTAVRLLGGFAVVRGGRDVPLSEWGSRRARLLCRRLAAACGEPIPREQLTDLLWPDEADIGRLGARLSVQLSTVRRVLGGGVVADRDTIRIDPDQVGIDLVELHRAVDDGRTGDAVATYRGDLLPEDLYEAWAEAPRERARSAYASALRAEADGALADQDLDRAIDLARRLLGLDPYDTDAHRRLVRALDAGTQHGEARRARDRYAARMHELGIEPEPL
jgi:pimeloyl-ACP methyl ester carboxylesterase/DNA-binding SARP family transcriptional activator